MKMYYYKATLPNGKDAKFCSLDYIRYNPYKDEMISTKEQNAEYVLIENEIYRVPWLKYEPRQTIGKYPVITTYFITKEEYDEYEKEKREKLIKEIEEMERLES